MTERDEALAEVARLATRHGLTVDEIATALGGGGAAGAGTRQGASGLLSRVLGYIGGTLVCVGLAIYVGMRWDELGSLGRVLVTLGPGLCTFAFALVATTTPAFERATTPLFLSAGLLEPTGILVAMAELSRGGDPRYAVLAMNAVMLLQQGTAFAVRRRTVLAFTSVVFALGFLFAAFDILDAGDRIAGLVVGGSLVCVAWSLDRSRHAAIAGVVYLTGAAFFLGAAWDVLRNGPAELLFALVACGVIALSTWVRSRSLLVAGTLALVGYVAYYVADNFADQVAAPILLMVMGLMLIGIGAVAVRLNKRYIEGRRAG